MNQTIDGDALKQWRESRKMSLRDVATLLGVSSPSTVQSWESGQDIPGPAQLLLGMLIHGKQPFGASEDTSAEEAKHFWQLKLTLADWHKLEALATAGGFGTVRDYLLSLIQEHLNAGAAGGASFGGQDKDVLIKAEVCAILPSVSTATSSATGRKAPSRPSSGATIVPLPTAHWSKESGGGHVTEKVAETPETPETPVVSEERRPVVYEKPVRGKKKAE